MGDLSCGPASLETEQPLDFSSRSALCGYLKRVRERLPALEQDFAVRLGYVDNVHCTAANAIAPSHVSVECLILITLETSFPMVFERVSHPLTGSDFRAQARLYM